jgi:hypothetical protein
MEPILRPDVSNLDVSTSGIVQPVIRTYAKDAAAAQNLPPPEIKSSEEKAFDSVILPDVDESRVEYRTPSSGPELKRETLSLSQNDSDGIFTKDDTLMQVTPPEVAIQSQSREDILARLRSKLSSHTQGIPYTIEEPALPVNHGDSVSGFLSRQNSISGDTMVPQIPVQKPLAENLSPIHTYTSDFSDHISEKQASAFTVLAAQQDQGAAKILSSPQKNNVIPVVLGILLCVLTLGGIYYVYTVLKKDSLYTETTTPAVITGDMSASLSGQTGIELSRSFATMRNQSVPSGNVLLVSLDSVSTTTATNSFELLRRLDIGIPEILLRNTDSSAVVGVINVGSENVPFFVLTVTSYERTFSGMLTWENTMEKNLSTIFGYSVSEEKNSLFTDLVASNHDVRVVLDETGKQRLLYGYINKSTLIITRDENAFSKVIEHLNKMGSL